MKIVNLETFRALPPWTVFRKFRPMVVEDMCFKLDTWEVDFIYQAVDMPESNGSEQLFDRLEEMAEKGTEYPMDDDQSMRDGLFEKDQLFLIYNRADLLVLRGFIDKAIEATH